MRLVPVLVCVLALSGCGGEAPRRCDHGDADGHRTDRPPHRRCRLADGRRAGDRPAPRDVEPNRPRSACRRRLTRGERRCGRVRRTRAPHDPFRARRRKRERAACAEPRGPRAQRGRRRVPRGSHCRARGSREWGVGTRCLGRAGGTRARGVVRTGRARCRTGRLRFSISGRAPSRGAARRPRSQAWGGRRSS